MPAFVGENLFLLGVNLVSLERIALGFFCAAAGGVLLSALAYHVKLIRDILALPVAVLKATPVASFIVLVLIWMPSRNLSILISFIMAFPIIYTNLLEGFEHLDRELFEMAKIFRMKFCLHKASRTS